jgi:hypothetical protein
MVQNIPDRLSTNPGLMTNLTDRVMNDALKAGIRAKEIEEEVDSVFAVIVEAVANQGGGLPD